MLRIREGHEDNYKCEEGSGIAEERPEYGRADDHADNDRTNNWIIGNCKAPKTNLWLRHRLRNKPCRPVRAVSPAD